MKQRSPKNKTITLTDDEYKRFSQQLLRVDDGEKLSLKKMMNKTINSDLFAVIDILPDSFADLIIIDPPYNLSKNFNGLLFKSMKLDAYREYLELWFPKIVRCLKPSGSLYLCGDWKCTAILQEVMSKYLTIMNRITWQRDKGRGSYSNWKNTMEDIWFGVKDKTHYNFNVDAVKQRRKVIAPYKLDGKPKDWEETDNGKYRTTYPSNFWDDICVPYWSMPENTDHPTQKPEKLIAKLILASSCEGDVVFDPFLGVGTTSVVAKKLKRRYIGIEINEEYCCLAEKRLAMADTAQQIQGYSGGVFWERNSRVFLEVE
jgi:site-specific DNA-methyltransferase (adenine-specific)